MKPGALLRFRAVPPAWLLPSILLSWALDRYWPIHEWLPSPWNYLLSIPVWVSSLMITGSAARTLARHGTTIFPNRVSTALVVDGPYRYTRNPMYLGMALIVLGSALFLGSIGALAGVAAFVCAVQILFILPEERRLEAGFGDAYRSYCQRVRRWI